MRATKRAGFPAPFHSRSRGRLLQPLDILDEVGALIGARDAGKGHLGAGHDALGVGEELVEEFGVPRLAEPRHAGGIGKAGMLSGFLAEDSEKVRTLLGRATTLERVTGVALLGHRLALLGVRLGKTVGDRLDLRGNRGGTTPARGRFRQFPARLDHLLRRNQRRGEEAEAHHHRERAEHGHRIFVEFTRTSTHAHLRGSRAIPRIPAVRLAARKPVCAKVAPPKLITRFAWHRATRISPIPIATFWQTIKAVPQIFRVMPVDAAPRRGKWFMSAPVVLIPARMAATRLPDKPMADINGLPMIVQVWKRAMEADVGPVVVATDSEVIAGAVRDGGGTAVITRSDHPSGSDRIYEALEIFDSAGRYDRIINVQGDLPTIEPQPIRAAMTLLDEPAVDIATVVAVITRDEERTNPAVVKAIGTPLGGNRYRALYFTRATAPTGEGPLYHHIGLYAYRRLALRRFIGLKPTPLELREKLEQLRALESGMRIDFAVVDTVPLGVDTPADLDHARTILAGRFTPGGAAR